MQEELTKEFISQSIYRLDESMRMLQISLESITEEEFWKKPNRSLNSIANILLHLCGNITQYAIASLGEKPDIRERDKEFSVESGYTKAELLVKLIATVEAAKMVISTASPTQLIKKRKVQGFDFSGIAIIVHVVEHLSYHTGQIAFWTKQLKNSDLGFYKGHNLNKKNE
ncbi:hypothetical protein MNBD_BACTEROID03-2103 [hydrothermal vent metagenome]|uniref:DUF1572 domain-containing protein n=1 Tax=hydrothermal vent metagenome TaxID=652676 RepID=A0A3B0T965_9ZZZZ